MIEVRIASLNADAATGQPIVLLKPLEDELLGFDGRLLPIWIGHPEATAILLALEGEEFPRPLTHDLLKAAIDALGARVMRVAVTRLEAGTYYAEIVLSTDGGNVVLDARPSDSIALAVRCGCPIYVAEDVFAEAAVHIETEEDVEEELRRFREFLDHVDPSDFTS
ncbi:MAG: bifunctional nuclease family protein [Anaerosomatales bacterium]|nr:bifunctional nuclease family protein [Anaerosomatales bacterium]